MSCATGTIKYTLFTLNTLWGILGIVIMGFGGLGWGAMPQTFAIIIIVVGGLMLITSFIGCLGAMRESTRMLWAYITLMILFLVMFVVMVFFTKPDTFKRYAMQGVEHAWSREFTQLGAMDYVQKTYHCCGRDSPEDYINNARIPPSSCCKDNNCINPLNLYTTGCLAKVQQAFSDEVVLTNVFRWLMIGMNLTITILAIMLAIHLTNHRRRYSY